MMIVCVITRYYIVVEIINYLELIILMFITRRFMRIYYKIKKHEEKNFYMYLMNYSKILLHFFSNKYFDDYTWLCNLLL